VLIFDIRRTPVAEDRQLLDWLRAYDIPPLLVVTKCDKVSRNERAKQAAVIANSLGVERGELTFFSTLTREGKDEIWTRIERVLFPEPAAAGQGEGQP
jgi:GTP-binding protein